MADRIKAVITETLEPKGFECHPFKVGWYNDQVAPAFILDHDYDTLAYIVISTPHMFDKAFVPFITRQECSGVRDPIDECIAHHFTLVKEALPDEDMISIHDFEMLPSRRPKVLVQTAGHVAGAARYYQRSDVNNPPWPQKKKIFGVSVHPVYGGWFALRGVLIFPKIKIPDLVQKPPPDVVAAEEDRIELLNRFNGNWQDWTFRDIIKVSAKYSEAQKQYFATLPKDRRKLVEDMRKGLTEENSPNGEI